MGSSDESTANLAVFCDYENLAIGAKDAKFGDFNINVALERLLAKGKIIYKRPIAIGSVTKMRVVIYTKAV